MLNFLTTYKPVCDVNSFYENAARCTWKPSYPSSSPPTWCHVCNPRIKWPRTIRNVWGVHGKKFSIIFWRSRSWWHHHRQRNEKAEHEAFVEYDAEWIHWRSIDEGLEVHSSVYHIQVQYHHRRRTAELRLQYYAQLLKLQQVATIRWPGCVCNFFKICLKRGFSSTGWSLKHET